MIYTGLQPPLISGLQLTEGSRWHDGRLWFSDLKLGRLYTIDPDGAIAVVAEFDEPCSGLGFLAGGTPIIALMRSSRIVRVQPDGSTPTHADLTPLGGTHLNDAISDAHGRMYVDLLSYSVDWGETEVMPDGARRVPFSVHMDDTVTDRIALVEPDGSARVVAEDLMGPNGLAIPLSGDRLFVSEYRVHKLTVFDIDPADGGLSNRRLLTTLQGGPDGICLDEEGAVWCASPPVGAAFRISPSGDIVDEARPMTGTRVMACVLGGDDRRTLYLMTNHFPDPASAMVETVLVDVPGAGSP